LVWILLLVHGGQGIFYISDAAKKVAEEKWQTPAGHPYPEPWNELDPPETLSASEADHYFPEEGAGRQSAVFWGVLITLLFIVGAIFGYCVQAYWLIAVGGLLALLTLVGTINVRERALIDAPEKLRRERRGEKFRLAVEEGTACWHCRRGKPKNTSVCPTCGFSATVYSAEAAAKKAARYVIKESAYLAARTTWGITKGAAKLLWWLATPTKKRFPGKPVNPPL